MSQLFTTLFGRDSTASEVIEGVDLSGRRAIVTGGGSGIGVETARALAANGAEVTLAVRRPEAGEQVAADLREATGNDAIHVARLDVADLESVRAFTAGWQGPLHILINNAGIMMPPDLERGIGGHEQQFATNYLGHFALALGLHRALADGEGARLVSVSSSGHLFSSVVFDDIAFRFRPYDALVAYGQSKTAVILLAVEAQRRWSGDGITANSLHPGAIATNLQRHTGGLRTPEPYRKTIEQGAATTVFLAASPLVEGIGGRYFEDVNEALSSTNGPPGWASPAWPPTHWTRRTPSACGNWRATSSADRYQARPGSVSSVPVTAAAPWQKPGCSGQPQTGQRHRHTDGRVCARAILHVPESGERAAPHHVRGTFYGERGFIRHLNAKPARYYPSRSPSCSSLRLPLKGPTERRRAQLRPAVRPGFHAVRRRGIPGLRLVRRCLVAVRRVSNSVDEVRA